MWVAILALAGCIVVAAAVLIQVLMEEHWRKFRWFEIEEESADGCIRRRRSGR